MWSVPGKLSPVDTIINAIYHTRLHARMLAQTHIHTPMHTDTLLHTIHK